jgi:ABC-type sugar transport system ATPase subunit
MPELDSVAREQLEGMMAKSRPILSASNIVKHFGGVQALRGVTLSVRTGEVLGLVGDNGAGKSTLIKILAGAEVPDSGELKVNGEEIHFKTPAESQAAGIQVVYQDLALCGNLTIVQNVHLHREILKWKVLGKLAPLDKKEMRIRTRALLDSLGLISSEDMNVPVARLSGGQQQIAAIARALHSSCKVLLLDEPTAALGVKERSHVLKLIRELRSDGMAIIVVSHNLDELMEIADRILVLRLGCSVGEFEAASTSATEIVAAIVGVSGDAEN